ncbi:TKL/TKL-UNIQUE protein kinase [Saprolegnia diclina VS20]|uniref:TKL/TKL-UNIQUE protein kinase n=1 Tax=Saprolegnia diclina (strain VS20) TaxID=1156394 RepID=T0R3N4_SAPDV|nr:TKL/TKL-UNIQUE protein kinase [Saprolegnia diclina VS20]EQC26663.1 TKL/TKL-UNIQUE protein kinase [Saprolegnia diclina VS20]|eukprot:XP_008619898.1 TKL/TKL-UNIQUE protein kinase [Saprolegnia diclina VS20]
MDVDAPLGVGGYGAVYKGTYNGRSVAIKTAVGPDGAATLLDETKTMLLCRSPYVLELLAVTKAPNPKLILEYMDAGDLRSYLDAKRLNQPTKVDVSSLEVAWVVANALADLHHDGLLHRDIKSPNVLLCSQNYIKLADLGIAREYESNMTMGIGTLRWMAPELLNPQQRYNSAADMYAFGVLLTELDSLAVPFANETSVPTIMRKLGDGALTPEFTPSCPTWLKDLATACVSFDPKMRPTAQEVIHDLRKQLVGQPSQPTTTAIMNIPETSLSILPSAPAAEMARAMPLREEVEPEDMPSSLVAQFSFNPRHLTTSSSWSSKGEPTPEPPHANASPMVSGNTEMNSLGVTSLVCQLCNTTNSLLDETCADCAESLPPAPFKLKILVRRLATHSVHHIATTIACFTCSDVSPMTRAACDCGEEFPPDAAKLHMLFKRIELAGSNSTP